LTFNLIADEIYSFQNNLMSAKMCWGHAKKTALNRYAGKVISRYQDNRDKGNGTALNFLIFDL